MTIANGVRPALDADPARGRSLARAERYVLALGTIEPRKDLPGLVTAFDAVAAEVPDVDLVVAGADGWGVDAFEAALRNAARRERIHRLGEVSDRDRDDLLAGAAVLAYPSLYEGFGMPPLEAMSLDVPVVSSDAGRSRTPWETPPMVPARDPDALAGALLRVLGDDVAESSRSSGAGAGWPSRGPDGRRAASALPARLAV